MDVREKLVELLANLDCNAEYCKDCEFAKDIDGCVRRQKEIIADRLIANGVMVQEWISVEDRLPEEGDRYLCRLKSFAFPGSFYQSILRYDKYGFQDGGVYEEGVTHWMPLPQPPKGD